MVISVNGSGCDPSKLSRLTEMRPWSANIGSEETSSKVTSTVTGIATERGNTSCCEPSKWGSNGVKTGSHPSKS